MRWYWDTLGVEMIQGWGMTETNPLGTLSRRVAKRKHRELSLDAQFENVAKAGLLMPGLELEIVDDDWKPLPHDGRAAGNLLIRGPWICSEYFNDPQPEKFHDGWLVTGDVAKIDAEEYLIIADRSKDLIKSGGEWISSVDLENHIVVTSRCRRGGRGRAAAPEVGRAAGRAGRARRGAARCSATDVARALRDDVREVAAPRRGALRRRRCRSRRPASSTRRSFARSSRARATSSRTCARGDPRSAGRHPTRHTAASRREMAEREGFEPPVPVRVQRFSRPPRSTAPASLRGEP